MVFSFRSVFISKTNISFAYKIIYLAGDLTHLLDYEAQRQMHVLPIMATVDGLNRLYGTTLAPIVMLRSLGLQATDALKPLKVLLLQIYMLQLIVSKVFNVYSIHLYIHEAYKEHHF